MRRSAASIVILLLGVGCGARSGLEIDPRDGGGIDATVPDAGPPECERDDDCDDAIPCTANTCEGQRCVTRPRDSECDDGQFCTGPGRCDPLLGCVFETDPCDDGVDCTESMCFERARRCEPIPQNELCPVSFRCDVDEGCLARALVHDLDGVLWEVDLPGGRAERIAQTGLGLTDLALTPDGQLFALASGISESSLVQIDESDGTSRRVGFLGVSAVGLDVLGDGQLVAAGEDRVFTVDPETGRSRTFARFPAPFVASGDIAFVRERMLVTGTTAPFSEVPDVLFEVPPDGGELVEVGSVGVPCVWGLAPFGDTLYGFDCDGRLLDIDPDSGLARILLDVGPQRWGGAAAR
ncbi:MAG: TolB family protein [Sandaracinaceae bacterium]